MSQRKKFQSLAEETGIDLGQFFNRNIRETLKAGIEALVKNTHHDSSRAATHWLVIPNKGNFNYGQWKYMKFEPAHGVKPVGRIGDKGVNRAAAIKAVTSRETARAINKAVSGRNPATKFVFHNATPESYDDRLGKEGGSGTNYQENARLEDARKAAESVMKNKFERLVTAGKVRVNKL